MHCLTEEIKWVDTSINSWWLNHPGDKYSYSLREELVMFNNPRENWHLASFLPQSSRLMLEPPHRTVHTCNEPLFGQKCPFGSKSSCWLKHKILEDHRELGQLWGTPYPNGTWRPYFHIPFTIISLWGSLITQNMLSSLGLKFLKSHIREKCNEKPCNFIQMAIWGRKKNAALLLYTSPSLPRGHPKRKPFGTLPWTISRKIKLKQKIKSAFSKSFVIL